MIFVKIDGNLHSAIIRGNLIDKDWDGRATKSITLEMDYATAIKLFANGLAWSIVQREEIPTYDENGEQTGTETKETEYDNSEYNLAGDITDHRDGTITVKMGKPTDLENAYEMLYGGI